MSPSVTIGILAEFEPSSEPHHATNEALRHAADPLGVDLAYAWIGAADHAETGDPGSSELVITQLECSLVGEVQEIRIAEGSLSSLAYGAAAATEELRCGFGLNPESRERLEQSPLRVVGSSEDDAVRIVELADHPLLSRDAISSSASVTSRTATPASRRISEGHLRGLVVAHGGSPITQQLTENGVPRFSFSRTRVRARSVIRSFVTAIVGH